MKLGYVVAWLVVIGLHLFAASTLVHAYVVPTPSMEGSLQAGDHILVDKLVPHRQVDRGDIIAFRYPEHPEQTFVKRLIGMPGDRIRLVDKQVIRNGRRLVESYARHTGPTRDPYRDDFPSVPPSRASMRRVRAQEMFDHHVVNGELIVPAGALFVMGDNRDNSLDSRYWGFVPSENVVGRPLFVYWSYAAEEEDGSQRGNFAQHFLSRTRWERTLFVPRSQAAIEVDP